MSAPLEIPAAALDELFVLHGGGTSADVRLIAAPVVAAELRRLAAEWSHNGVMYSVVRDLRARADEIEAAS